MLRLYEYVLWLACYIFKFLEVHTSFVIPHSYQKFLRVLDTYEVKYKVCNRSNLKRKTAGFYS
jgi:hypothetical protein